MSPCAVRRWTVSTAAGATLALSAVLSGCGSSTSVASIVTGTTTIQTSPSASGTPSGSPLGGQRTVLSVLGLNLRDAPGGNTLGVLSQGAVVTVLDHSDQNPPCDGKGGWFKVKAQTTTGWIADCENYSSAHLFNFYQSDQRGFSVLYYQSWTFAEQPEGVVFRPQSGPQTIVLSIAKSLDALGPPGRSGYSVASADTILVYGVTGVLRLYDRTGSPESTTSAVGTPLAHFAQFRAVIDSNRAIRIDYNYDKAEDLTAFRDFYNSVIFPAPVAATPSPTPHP